MCKSTLFIIFVSFHENVRGMFVRARTLGNRLLKLRKLSWFTFKFPQHNTFLPFAISLDVSPINQAYELCRNITSKPRPATPVSVLLI